MGPDEKQRKNARRRAFWRLMDDPLLFIEHASDLRLRRYQEAVARAVIESVRNRRGLSFVVMFPRQSGKNELQAQIEAYLLGLFAYEPAEIVKVSPTWKPQSLNAMRRLERVLKKNLYTQGCWSKENGYVYRVGDARIFFLSGAPEANIVGATASTLLEVDEAQDVSLDKFDRDIAPMAASTNATRVFWGTAWTSRTLLARELRAALAAERQDGIRRAFVLTAEEVACEVPAYGQFVAGQVARMGRNHPMVKTQFFSEEIDAEGGMFPPERIAKMAPLPGGLPPAIDTTGGPRRGRIYAFLLDVAGEDGAATNGPGAETGGLEHPQRDATALTIVEVDRSTLIDPLLRAPRYHAVARRGWVGAGQAQLYSEIRALSETWQPRALVVDATGIGAGLASFLSRAFPGRVISFLFSQASKSKLGWDFLNVVDEGRWKESPEFGNHMPGSGAGLAADFLRELAFCQYELLSGPGQVMRWGVPDGTRDPASGELVHDDWVMSAALCTLLDGLSWPAPVGKEPGIVRAADPMEEKMGF